MRLPEQKKKVKEKNRSIPFNFPGEQPAARTWISRKNTYSEGLKKPHDWNKKKGG